MQSNILNSQLVNQIFAGQLLDVPKPAVTEYYPQEFKREVLDYVKEWGSSNRASFAFKIQRTTIDRWVRDDNRY